MISTSLSLSPSCPLSVYAVVFVAGRLTTPWTYTTAYKRTRKVFAYVRLTYLDIRGRSRQTIHAFTRVHTRTRVYKGAGTRIATTNALTLRLRGDRPGYPPPFAYVYLGGEPSRVTTTTSYSRRYLVFERHRAHGTSHGYFESAVYTLFRYSMAGATTRHATLAVSPRWTHEKQTAEHQPVLIVRGFWTRSPRSPGTWR